MTQDSVVQRLAGSSRTEPKAGNTFQIEDSAVRDGGSRDGCGVGGGTDHHSTRQRNRREFLGQCMLTGAGLCAWSVLGDRLWAAAQQGAQAGPDAGGATGSSAEAATGLDTGASAGLTEARYYKSLSGGRTQCGLCPNYCVREDGQDGQCRARGNRGGTYYSLVYGRPCVVALDEAAKCPLNHVFLDGKLLSIATAGCNLTCRYCQNWEFSQSGPEDVSKSYQMSPGEVVSKALENDAKGISFFYTEPTIYYEYMLDIAKLARRRRLKTVMVTAGYINPEPLVELVPYLDAVTVGLKGFDQEFYKEYVGGELEYVKATIELLASRGKGKNGRSNASGRGRTSSGRWPWWEVVNLIVPSLNDDMDNIAEMARWLREVAGATRPLHFTRFRPEYKLRRLPMTPADTLTRARKVALAEGLQHVYVGNMPGHEGANTYCPKCSRVIVERMGFTVLRMNIKKGKCGFCGRRIGGIWS